MRYKHRSPPPLKCFIVQYFKNFTFIHILNLFTLNSFCITLWVIQYMQSLLKTYILVTLFGNILNICIKIIEWHLFIKNIIAVFSQLVGNILWSQSYYDDWFSKIWTKILEKERLNNLRSSVVLERKLLMHLIFTFNSAIAHIQIELFLS